MLIHKVSHLFLACGTRVLITLRLPFLRSIHLPADAVRGSTGEAPVSELGPRICSCLRGRPTAHSGNQSQTHPKSHDPGGRLCSWNSCSHGESGRERGPSSTVQPGAETLGMTHREAYQTCPGSGPWPPVSGSGKAP